MTWAAVVLWTGALICAAALSQMVRRLLWTFMLAAGVLLALHWGAAPGESAAGFGALALGLALLRPARRLASAAGLGP